MKITDIKNFPVRVKLTKGFTLDDSYDEGMIIQINSTRPEPGGEVYGKDGRCFEVWTTVLPEDVEYNKSVSKRDWLDENSNPTLDYFEANPGHKKPNGSYEDKIFVMEEDDFCVLVDKTPKDYQELIDLILYVDNLGTWNLDRKDIVKLANKLK